MYREAAASGVLKGVPAGPYNGGGREIDAAKLSPGARRRLADVLGGRAELTPILYERRAVLPRFQPTWTILLGTFGLFGITAQGYANASSYVVKQPYFYGVAYAVCFAMLVGSILEIARRRVLVSGTALTPGRYLLPLDILEVGALARSGTQHVLVTPLGDARDVRVRDRELVIVFARGAEVGFPLRGGNDGESALRRLAHAQSLLEQLTYHPDPAVARANDALFEARTGDAWNALAPSPASKRARSRTALLRGPLATALAVVVSGALGASWLAARNWASGAAVTRQHLVSTGRSNRSSSDRAP